MSQESRVVITGLGVASPLGIGASSFWDALIERRSGIGPITSFDASTLPSRVGGQVPAIKMTDYVPKAYRKSIKLMARDIELAVVAAHQAAFDASIPTRCMIDRGEAEEPAVDSTRLGANIGAGLICPDLTELGSAFATALDDNGEFDLVRWGGEGMRNLTPLWLLKFLPNMLACHVTIVHDAQAASNTITCGEASSHLAIGEAYRNIARGTMDVCFCGGAESKMNPMSVARAALMGRLACDGSDDPASACRPFATNQCGAVVSEGAGLLILESLDHAKKRDARIYAELKGFGSAGNAYSWSEPDPSGAGLAIAIRSALADAGVEASNIDLASAFGCGIAEQDAAELNAWRTVLGPDASDVPALAIKGAVGNNGAGSGALDVCGTVLSLYHNTIPASLNTTPTQPESVLKFVDGDAIDARVDTAVSVGYALSGGQNAALVIQRYSE
jgi:3-oxoacyl-[acyl-carrier-protein] synthase II